MFKHTALLSLGLVLAASTAAQAQSRPSVTVWDAAQENYDVTVQFERGSRPRANPCVQQAAPRRPARCVDPELEAKLDEIRADIRARGAAGDRCERIVKLLRGDEPFEVVRTGSSCEIRPRR